MAFRKTFRRPSLREQLLSSERALNFMAAAADKPPVDFHIPPKRERRAPDPADSEAPVVAAVGELLAAHPQVLFAVRQNSGAMHVPSRINERLVPIWFYRVVRAPENVTLPDYWGFLRDCRAFAIECKRPSWKKPHDDRERRQAAYIQMIEAIGGVGGFVRSADEAQALLA